MRPIGPGQPCFIIAEAGVNHNGKLDIARRLVDAAADAGADAVKFQTWITEEVCAVGASKAEYQKADGARGEDQFTMLKRLELPFAWHAELRNRAEERGIVFLSTPDDIQSARFLRDLGVPGIKVGSAEITNLPYLRELASLHLPLILSTGMATADEIEDALAELRKECSDVPLALLHCISAYPAPEEEMNLRCIRTIRESFGLPTGLSDHTTGSIAAQLGVALEIAIYERHLTLDRRLPGPDHAASTEPGEFAEVVQAIRKAERMMGSGIKRASASEIPIVAVVRRTLAYTRPLSAGHLIAEGDIKPLRTSEGAIPPRRAGEFRGKTLLQDVAAGAAVQVEHFSE